MSEDVTATDGPPREVRTARETAHGPAFGSVSRARFDAPIEDMWPLFTDPERMREWNPSSVTGEFRLGGEFSVKDNASGQVLRCDPPTSFRVSWIYQDIYSELEVRLGSIGGGATVVEIEHLMTADAVERSGMTLSENLVAGGAGWDLALDFLGRYLRGELEGPPTANGDWEPTATDLERYGQYQKAWQKVVQEALDE